MEDTSLDALENILKYAPKDMVIEMLLKIDDKYLVHLCNLNDRVKEICLSSDYHNRYKLKYKSGWFARKPFLVPKNYDLPAFFKSISSAPKQLNYTDGNDTWVTVSSWGVSYYGREMPSGERITIYIVPGEKSKLNGIFVLNKNKDYPNTKLDFFKSIGKSHLIDPVTEQFKDETGNTFINSMKRWGIRIKN